VAYVFLPVASMPSVDFPTIRVSAQRPGADPATMAATVAAPLERRLGEIAGVTEITSSSSLGSTSITVQFELSRNIDKAAQDVQAALNAAAADLPSDLPTLPIFRKANPSAFPVLILALTSKTLPPSAIYDLADTVVAQRLSQAPGVAEVIVSGAEQPAIRVRLEPARLAAMGLSLEAVRTAIAAANGLSPVGVLDGATQALTLATNDQLTSPEEFGRIVVRARNGVTVRLADVATVERGTRNSRAAGSYNGLPAVTLQVTRQPGSNVVETVDRVLAILPELRPWLPAALDIEVMSDRTLTIRASLRDMQWTLAETVALVMLVVFLFLRRARPTLAAGKSPCRSRIAGTLVAMWLAGFTLDNLSLMAITRLGRLRGRRRDRDDRERANQARCRDGPDRGRHRRGRARSASRSWRSASRLSRPSSRSSSCRASSGASSRIRPDALGRRRRVDGRLPHGRARHRRPGAAPEPARTTGLDRTVEAVLGPLIRGYGASLGFALRHPGRCSRSRSPRSRSPFTSSGRSRKATSRRTTPVS
jgi:hypothetical protein